jgi:acetoin utilization protein AcuB
MKQEWVKDWMICNVVTLTSNTTVPEPQRLMTEHGIRRLPVVENGHLVGIVTRGDIREAAPSSVTALNTWELNDLLAKMKMGQIMTPKPTSIAQDATRPFGLADLLERVGSALDFSNSRPANFNSNS